MTARRSRSRPLRLPSAVPTEKDTAELSATFNDTGKLNAVVPELPSGKLTLPTDRQPFSALAEFRGAGATGESKSAEFTPESRTPAALAKVRCRVAEPRGRRCTRKPSLASSFTVPKATKSTGAMGQAPENALVELATATLPCPDDMGIVPVASGVGRSVVPPVPCAS